MTLSKMHQRVNNRAEAKRLAEVAGANGQAVVHASPDSKPVTTQTMLENDAELARIMEELDSRQLTPENDFWDQAQSSYHDINKVVDEASLGLANELDAFVKDEERKAKLSRDQAGRLTLLVNQVGRDIAGYKDNLNQTYEIHKDKTGGVKGGDETMQMLEVQDAYQQQALLFNKQVVPMVTEINEIIGVTERAAKALLEQQQAAKAREDKINADIVAAQEAAKADPNVISDAVVAEAPSTDQPQA